MPGSQLKRLKASLRESGVIGPQQSKKQRNTNNADAKAKNNSRLQKAAKLDSIRDQFNPFDLKHNVRGPKFAVTTNKPNASKAVQGRPSEAKALGEERRRQTLLVEANRRNKVGGIVDRRFGENDPSMAPEDKMMERYAREKQQAHKKGSLFDLEDDDEEGVSLTHMGKSLSFDGPGVVDDFDEDMEAGSDDEHDDAVAEARLALKRMRSENGEENEDEDAADGQPEKKKTKQEVYKEIMAKSKLHKLERQQAKDADEDLREELDMELPQLHSLLFNNRSKTAPADAADPQSAAAQAVAQREKLERDYDLRLRQLAQDRRAQPSDKTKTDEEKAEEESKRLKELEEKRVKRMQGIEDSESEEEDDKAPINPNSIAIDGQEMFIEHDEEDQFGLGKGIKTKPTAAELGFDDEDDFELDDDLIASGSDLEPIESGDEDDSDDDAPEEQDDDDDDDFTKGILNDEETANPVFSSKLKGSEQTAEAGDDDNGIPFTFPCPQTLEEFHDITSTLPLEKIPIAVQRIRALYHPKLDSENKGKLAVFSKILVQYLSHLPEVAEPVYLPPSFIVLETLTRHVHSLAKTFPIEVSNEFRSRLEDFGKTRPLSPTLGDLVCLTAIGTTFPTSDHFHQVVTPAMMVLARYLGQKIPKKTMDFAQGAYLSTLALQYQQVAKRYVPEVMNFTLNTLCALAPVKAKASLGSFPVHEPATGVRITGASGAAVRKLAPLDCAKEDLPESEGASTRVAILSTTLQILEAAADLWSSKSSFLETFTPAAKVLGHLSGKACREELPASLNEQVNKLSTKLQRMLRVAQMSRRTVELHHHKPLAIKTAIPKFEDSFDPAKHYDPDRDRAELAKLKAQHKQEKKGALRELRKDANFMAREKLKAKKSKDAAYEKKYKRLVAEIQNEEGREANAYEREREQRKRAAKRK